MPTFELEFSVYCSCGAGLCKQTEVDQGSYENKITVEPCEVCLKKAREEGHKEGYDQAYEETRENVEAGKINE